MTIAEINNLINTYQSSVSSKSDSIKALVNDDIRTLMNLAQANADASRQTYIYENFIGDRYQSDAIGYIIQAINDVTDDYEVRSKTTRDALRKIVNDYYANITNYVQSGLVEVERQINEASGITLADVDNRIAPLEDALWASLTNLESEVYSTVYNIESSMNDQIASVSSDIDAVESTFLTDISNSATEIYNTVTDWVDNVWDTINSIYTWTINKINESYSTLMDWTNRQLDHLNELLNVGFINVNLAIGNVYSAMYSTIDNAIASLSGYIDNSITTLSNTVDAIIGSISDSISEFSISLDWRFNFLQISLSLPELAIMQVLTRPDELFEKYKPYWKALFARIIEDA